MKTISLFLFLICSISLANHDGEKNPPAEVDGKAPNLYKSASCTATLKCTKIDEGALSTNEFEKKLTLGAMEPEAKNESDLLRLARQRLDKAVSLVQHRGVNDSNTFCSSSGQIDCEANELGEVLDVYNRLFSSTEAQWGLDDFLDHEAEHVFGFPDEMYCYYIVSKGRQYLEGSVHFDNSASSKSDSDSSSWAKAGSGSSSYGGFFRRFSGSGSSSSAGASASSDGSGWSHSSLSAEIVTQYKKSGYFILEERIEKANHKDARAMRQNACNKGQERYLKGNTSTDQIENCVCSRERILPKDKLFEYPRFDILADKPKTRAPKVPSGDSEKISHLKKGPARIQAQIKKNQEGADRAAAEKKAKHAQAIAEKQAEIKKVESLREATKKRIDELNMKMCEYKSRSRANKIKKEDYFVCKKKHISAKGEKLCVEEARKSDRCEMPKICSEELDRLCGGGKYVVDSEEYSRMYWEEENKRTSLRDLRWKLEDLDRELGTLSQE